MPAPAYAVTVPSATRRSAARPPTRRRRRRRSSRPVRRTDRGRTARARRSPRPHRRSGCRRRPRWDAAPDQVERGRAVGRRSPCTSVARCQRFGELERERLACREVRCVRIQRAEHARPREAVLVEVLATAEQRERHVVVGRLIGTAGRRACQHPCGDPTALHAHQRLRARPEQPIDGERQGVGVAERELGQWMPQVGALREARHDIARDHHLPDLVRADPLPPRSRPPPVKPSSDIAPGSNVTGCTASIGVCTSSVGPLPTRAPWMIR